MNKLAHYARKFMWLRLRRSMAVAAGFSLRTLKGAATFENITNSYTIKLLALLIFISLLLCAGCGGDKKDSYAEGVEALRAGRNEEAVRLFKRSLDEHPGNARAHNYLGTIYRRTGDQEGAQSEFEEAIAIDPSFGVAFYNLGRVYEERGMFDEALQKYMRAIDLAPDLVQAHNSLGVVSTRLGLYEKAVESFERSLDIDPAFESACFNLGIVYATKLGEKEKAKEYLSAYIKAAPGGDKGKKAQEILRDLGEESPVEFYDNGVELLAGGHVGKALEQFERALAIDPKYSPAILGVAGIYDIHVRDKEKAVRYYEMYLETNLKADDAPEVMSLLAKAQAEIKPSPEKAEKEDKLPGTPAPTPRPSQAGAGSVDDHRERALTLQRAGAHSSAIEEFERAAELDPELDMAQEIAISYHEVGVEHMEEENFDDAVGSFQKALSLSPSRGETEYQLGRAYAALNQFAKALESFDRAAAHGVSGVGKEMAAAYAATGEEHLKAGRYREAVRCYEKGLERNPSNAELHLRMARLLGKGEYHKRALGEYKKALDIDPNYAAAHIEVASLLENNLNDREGALLHYKRYLQLAPSGPDDRNVKAAVERLSRAVDELKKYREMVKKYPLRAEAHYNLAVILQERGMLDEAIAEYKKTVQQKPDFDRAYFNLGAVYMRRGYYDRAIHMYQKAIQLNPGYVKAHNNLGVLYSKRGRYNEALSSYGKALSADPGFASAHFNMALLYKSLGRQSKALFHYRKYIEYAPGGEYADEVREILKKSGRQES